MAIARALINDPVLVIADEPTGNLDSHSGEEIMDLLHTLHAQGTTIVMVTHDQKIAAHTQRTINLMDGVVDTSSHNGTSERRCNMKPSEAARIAWEAILKNKVRSFLTMLGIIIGVAAVIIMVAISAGTEATIQEQITSLGSNLIFVQGSMQRGGPGQAPTGGLVFDDAAAIQDGVSGVTSVVVEQNSSETVKYGDVTLEDISILGTTSGFPSVRDMEHCRWALFHRQGNRTQAKSGGAWFVAGRGTLRGR